MASVDVSQLSKAEHDELCCAYAALLLHDGEIEITVSTLTTAFCEYGYIFMNISGLLKHINRSRC